MKVRVPLMTVLLVCVNAALVTASGWRLLDGPWRADLSGSEVDSSAMQFPTLEAPPAAKLEAIQSRAVFHQSRSFYVAPPVQKVEQPPPDYRLAGSMSVPGKRSAVLIDSQSGARVRVSVGEQLEGWTVAAIGMGSVTIQRDDRSIEITAASRQANAGVTLVGAPQPPAQSSTQSSTQSSARSSAQSSGQSATQNGVRVIGNSAGRAARPQPAIKDSNQPPRLYRPPSP